MPHRLRSHREKMIPIIPESPSVELTNDCRDDMTMERDIAEGICAQWVRWSLLASAVREELACGSLGAAVRGVNIFDLKRANIPTPPTPEQAAIAKYITSETEKLDILATESAHAIALLQERRTALISAAVTGKIDVRGIASQEAA